MDSTVKSRPNHYETLGLEPTATSAEIEQAFTRELRRPLPFGGVAHLSIAYETLRDPAKRRAYDASIGIKPEPQPQPQPAVGHWLIARAVAARTLVRPAPADPVKRPADQLPPPAPQVKVEAEPAAASEPRLPSFLAASLREPAKPEPRHDIATLRRQPEPPRRAQVELKSGGDRLVHYAEEAGPVDAEDGSIPWKRTAISVGALVAAVGLFGAWAGWEAGNDIEAQPPERAVKVALPPAKARETSTAAAAPAPRVERDARLPRPDRPVAASTAIEPASPPPAAAPDPQPSEFARAAQSPGLDTAIEAFAAEAPAPAPRPAAASLGLPNRVVARTIERIGYSCGEVASTTAVDGTSGVFKVTCTSGSSYQARPVGGRYRFRRWGRQ